MGCLCAERVAKPLQSLTKAIRVGLGHHVLASLSGHPDERCSLLLSPGSEVNNYYFKQMKL